MVWGVGLQVWGVGVGSGWCGEWVLDRSSVLMYEFVSYAASLCICHYVNELCAVSVF